MRIGPDCSTRQRARRTGDFPDPSAPTKRTARPRHGSSRVHPDHLLQPPREHLAQDELESGRCFRKRAARHGPRPWLAVATRDVVHGFAKSKSGCLLRHEAPVGELVDFVSEDRLAASPDGTEFTPQRWSTLVGDYRDFGSRRAPTRGVGRWHPAAGDFTYIELKLIELEFNGGW